MSTIHPAGPHPAVDTRLTQLFDLQAALHRWLDANTIGGAPPVITAAEALSDAVDREITAQGAQPDPAARQAIAEMAAAIERYGDDALEATAFERSARAHRDPPAWGSQQWAETRGDDLGESPD